MPAASVFLSQSSIDGVIRMPGSMMDKFSQLAGKVFKNGVTWDKIILLFYVAGRMAIKVCVSVCANNTDQPPALHRPKKQHKSAHNHPNYMVHNYLNVCVCPCGFQVMEDNLPLQVIEIFKIALNYFKEKLLGWVASHGGWVG